MYIIEKFASYYIPADLWESQLIIHKYEGVTLNATQYNVLCKSVNCDAVTPWADISTVSLWGRSWCPSVRMLWWTPPARLSLILCSNQDYHAFSLGQAFTFSLGQASASSCDWDYHTFSLGQLSADFEIAHLAAKTTFRSNPVSVYWSFFHSSCRF